MFSRIVKGRGRNRFWKKKGFRRRANKLWEAYLRMRTSALRDELLELYMPLTPIVVTRMSNCFPNEVTRDELRADAMLGLWNAIERWRPEKSSFMTYSLIRMHGAIMDGLRERDPVSRRGRNIVSMLTVVAKALEEESGRSPTAEELAEGTGLPLKTCKLCLGFVDTEPFLSIEALIDRDKWGSVEGNRPNRSWMEEGDPEKYFSGTIISDYFDWLLSQIAHPQWRRVCHGYLLEGKLQKEIAKEEGVCPSRIAQIISKCRTIWIERSEWLRTGKET